MKTDKSRIFLLAIAAAAIGFVLAKIDTSPHWDDTGIIVVLVITTTAVFSFLQPRYAWLWAIMIGLPIPILNIIKSHNYGSFAALIFSFVGACSGLFMSRLGRE